MNQKLIIVVALLFSFNLFGQEDLIKKIFSSRSEEFQSKIKIVDTLDTQVVEFDEWAGYNYEIAFGLSDFENFLIYEYDNSANFGLIIYGKENSFFTDPIANGFRIARIKELGYEEGYEENGEYFSLSKAESFYVVFENTDKLDEVWEVGVKNEKYFTSKIGDLQKDIFRLVRLTEVKENSYPDQFIGAFVNLRTNEILESSFFKREILSLEAYSYESDYYYDEYYGEYYGEEVAPVEYGAEDATVESALQYTPVAIEYIIKADTVAELVSYDYVETLANSYYKKTAGPEFSGVWKIKTPSENADELIIIDGDDIGSAFRVFTASIDQFEGLYEVGRMSWDQVISKIPLSKENIAKLEQNWLGNKSNLNFIYTVGWSNLNQFKDYYISNDQNLVHIYLIASATNQLEVAIDFYVPEKTYSTIVKGRYDDLSYTSVFLDENENVYDLYAQGLYDFYEYGISAAKKNIDKDGNLVLIDEFFGNLSFKTHSPGNEYVGTYRLTWVGNPTYNKDVKVTSLTAQPYRILDENNSVLADDISYIYVDNAQGFNIYQVYNSDFKVGILGPDGKWLVEQKYDQVTISGPTSNYYYESAGFPLFFIVTEKDKYGLINAQGKLILPLIYESIEICTDEIITVLNGKMGLHSFSGELILPNEYYISGYYGYATDCYSFSSMGGNNKILEKNGKVGMINNKYEVVIPFDYLSLLQTDNKSNFIAGNANGKFGIINEKNETVVDFEFENIEFFDLPEYNAIIF